VRLASVLAALGALLVWAPRSAATTMPLLDPAAMVDASDFGALMVLWARLWSISRQQPR
jgi:hypothetical protein